MSLRIGFLVSHPIQYYAPIYRALAQLLRPHGLLRPSPDGRRGEAKAGYGVAFEWDVDLLSGYDLQPLPWPMRLASSPRPTSSPAATHRSIAQEIERGGFDAFLVPGWGLKSYLQAARACRRARVPVLVRGDSQLASQRGGALRVAKALYLPAVPASGSTVSSMLARGTASICSTTAFGRTGCSFPRTASTTRPFRNGSSAARLKSPRDPNAPARLLFVGKLVDSKRPFDLLEAAAMVRAPPRSEVAFAGAGEAEAKLKQVAVAVGVPARLPWLRQPKRVAEGVYAAADVIVAPSVETWGLVVNEAMACGLPAVVSDAVGCGPDLIEEGQTGAVFPLGRYAGLRAGYRTRAGA